MADEMDPIEAALAAKEKLAEERRAEDLHLWQQWKQNPTPNNMEPLMQRFSPLFRRKVQLWKAPNVNQAAFITNLKIQAVDAFQSYDPSRGAALGTHVEQRLQKAKRFNAQQQNYAYIPEGQSEHIGRIQQAAEALGEDLGRPPTPQEIANHLNPSLSARQQLTPKKIERIQNAQWRDVVGSSFVSDPTPFALNREREVINLLRPSLSHEQQHVYDYLYGQNGKPVVTSTTQLAQLLGKSPSQISRLRTGILSKLDELK